MNDQQRAELRELRQAQRALTVQLRVLDERLTGFERLAAEEAVTVSSDAPPRVPPVVALVPPSAPTLETPPPLPVIAPPQKIPVPLARDRVAEPAAAVAHPLVVSPLPVQSVAPVAPPAKGESLEMRIGSTWILYAGIVLVLTALAFMGNYLYHNLVPHLGPAAKVTLLYVAAGALAGAGVFLERGRQAQENSRLRTYARVVLAGGLAAVYYVTYAAHHFENLRVIDNAFVAGSALLAWTAFMVFLAHRRDSETLATVGILLAYYTSAINEGVAVFTLFSNLALTGGAVFLLRRHLWRFFPFASLLATFGSYGFWTYYHSLLGWRGNFGAPPSQAQHGPDGFWVEAAFLAVYWTLFTWAAFTAREAILPAVRRAGFVSLNNSAFYLLVTWLVVGKNPDWFWGWSLGFGVVLLALGELHRRFPRAADSHTEDAYLLGGVLLVTTGFVQHFEGWQLGLVLAVETVTLLASAARRSSRLLLFSSCATGILSFVWTLGKFGDKAAAGLWLSPLTVGVLLVGAAYLAQRLKDRPARADLPTNFGRDLAFLPSFYSFLGLGVLWWLIGERVPSNDGQVATLAGAAGGLTASVYFLRIKAVALYAQAFLGGGFVLWSVALHLNPPRGGRLHDWTALALLASSLALGHWWQRLPGAALWMRGKLSRCLNTGDALLAVLVIFLWFQDRVWFIHDRPGVPVAEAAGLALVVFGYGVATRYRALAFAAQGLLLLGVVFFAELVDSSWDGSLAEPLLAAAPFLVVMAVLAAVRFVRPVPPVRSWRRAGTLSYELLATLLFISWAFHYLPPEALLPALALAGAGVFALGVEKNERRWTLLSAVPTLVGVLGFLCSWEASLHASLLGGLGAAILAGQQQFGRRRLGERLPTWFPGQAQGGLLVVAVLCAWVFVTAKVNQWGGTSVTLAAGWSVFAAGVFAAGWFLRERIYRWLALFVLAVTLGHIVWFDLAQLDSLGKAISAFVLGVVALGISLLYNKYQDKFRDLL